METFYGGGNGGRDGGGFRGTKTASCAPPAAPGLKINSLTVINVSLVALSLPGCQNGKLIMLHYDNRKGVVVVVAQNGLIQPRSHPMRYEERVEQ